MEQLTIGGRAFRAIAESTLGHDIWLMQRVRAAQLYDFPMRAGETATDFAQRLLDHALASPAFFELVAGIILPADVADMDWKPAVAEDTAQFLAGLQGHEGKLQARNLVLTVLVPFLQSGLASLTVSAPSSLPDGQAIASESASKGS